MRRVVLATVMLLAFAAAPAEAGKRQLRLFQDDRLLVYSGPDVRRATLDQARSWGVDVIRTQMTWRNIEGPKHQYNWGNWDSLVYEARKRGLDVLATLTGPAPGWAAGKTGQFFEGSRVPNPKEFGRFVAAAGRRFNGRVKVSSAARSAGASRAAFAQADLLQPPPCIPVPPLITCPEPPPPPPDGGGSSPPPGGDQSPPPDPGQGQPSPPPPPGSTIPRIRMWSIYNEPNHPLFVSPQYFRGIYLAPKLYRDLYRAAHRALSRTGHARDTILIGETLPIGSNNRRRETSTSSPLRFARELFCLNGKGKRHPGCSGRFSKLKASGWAMHPYYRKTGPYSRPPGPDDVTPSTLGKLRRLLARASARGRVSRGLEVWDTENGAQTRPPDPKGTSPSRQARFINEAEYIAWKTPFVRSFSQYLMLDEEPVWAFQSGLHYRDGRAKPALAAYKMPIVVRKAGRGVVVWGRIPPGGGRRVTIDATRARDVTVRVRDRRGYFTRRIRGAAALRSRFVLRYEGTASRAATPAASR